MRARASSRAAATYLGSRPGLEPQKTQTRRTPLPPLGEKRHEEAEAARRRAHVAAHVPPAGGLLHGVADAEALGQGIVVGDLGNAVEEAQDAEDHQNPAKVPHRGLLFARETRLPLPQ